MKRITFTEEQIKEMVDLYQSGKSTIELADYYNCSRQTITRRLKENNIEIERHRYGHKNINDITNQVFGELTVKELIGTGSNGAIWRCECSCGNKNFKASGSSLVSNHTRSCGCLHRKTNALDISEHQFGKLIAKKIVGNKNNYALWLCECECGNTCEVSSNHLKSGSVSSCGCLSSKGNELITKILTDNNIIFKKEFSFKELKYNSKGTLRFDFAILNRENELLYLIEFDGEQHYLNKSYFGVDLSVLRERDKCKNKYCLEKNIILIRIPYCELNKLNLDLLTPKNNPYIVSKIDFYNLEEAI